MERKAVREYMGTHPEVVETISKRYAELSNLDTRQLYELAEVLKIDDTKVRAHLITAVMGRERELLAELQVDS